MTLYSLKSRESVKIVIAQPNIMPLFSLQFIKQSINAKENKGAMLTAEHRY